MKKHTLGGVSKNVCDFRMSSNLSDHQLKIDSYKYSLVYVKLVLSTSLPLFKTTIF